MRWIERQWQHLTPVSVVLLPLTAVFRAVVALRRTAYRVGLLRSRRLRVPVIVVGNITVGGTGKTPLVIWLASFLRAQGMRPGIVSRGYGGSTPGPAAVTSDSQPALTGDEPVLLAQRTRCPVWIGTDRAATADALLTAHPECDVILSDDGLQHYHLARDIEIAVVDGERGFGNGFMLPAGPLREPVSRLAHVDAVVLNGPGNAALTSAATFTMRIAGDEFHNVRHPGQLFRAEHFRGKRLHAIAGIGNPARFFDHLRALELEPETHVFPDHHALTASELVFAESWPILMTEKDAVKCAPFAAEHHWALRVHATPDAEFGELVLTRLRESLRS